MSDSEWLANLKEGDKVLIGTISWGHSYDAARITKVGKLHLSATIGHGSGYSRKFSIKNGYEVGNTYRTYLAKYDQKLLDKQQNERDRTKLAQEISETRWRDLDHKTLKAIAALLPKDEGSDA
jgi:hypothetical protein